MICMKITVLTENTSACGLPAEHGLSLFIETGPHRILFDAGQSDLFARNADALGIDLTAADLAVLSHGHYDHGGGMKEFLRLNHTAPLYINRNAFGPYYNGEKYIGLDPALKDHPRVVLTGDKTVVAENMTLFTCNEREKTVDFGSFGLSVLKNGEHLPDGFLHEQYLFIEENGKRVLISGCSHKGILNIMDWFRPDVLVGGFHFSKLPQDDTLRKYAEALNAFDADYYTCHCTGTEQYEYMNRFMTRLHYISAGDVIVVP